MRFSVSSTALSSKLTALSRVINSKNSLPILGDFVFEISDLGNNSKRMIEHEMERISVSNRQEEKGSSQNSVDSTLIGYQNVRSIFIIHI